MPRANRVFCPGYVWHVTHRCHKREFLLRCIRDRRRWRHWLWVAQRRYGLCVLNYMVTSNHIHLMVVDQGTQEITKSMQLVASRIAQEYNQRRKRKGAFWEDRFHATAVESGDHLSRCLVYVDLNMVRAGIVDHPAEWEFCGFNEIQTPRARKGVIDHEALCEALGISSIRQLQHVHRNWVQDEIAQSRRDRIWTESIAVGGEIFLTEMKAELRLRGRATIVKGDGDTNYLGEPHQAYFAF